MYLLLGVFFIAVAVYFIVKGSLTAMFEERHPSQFYGLFPTKEHRQDFERWKEKHLEKWPHGTLSKTYPEDAQTVRDRISYEAATKLYNVGAISKEAYEAHLEDLLSRVSIKKLLK